MGDSNNSISALRQRSIKDMTMNNMVYILTLAANVLWFTAAFRFFSFQQRTATKLLIKRSERESPLFEITAAFARFLGGMNGAFSLLSIILLALWIIGLPFFTDPIERSVLLLVFGAAHFSQFIFNVPVLCNCERQGKGYWKVTSGPMLFIFVTDFSLSVLNFVVAIIQFSA